MPVLCVFTELAAENAGTPRQRRRLKQLLENNDEAVFVIYLCNSGKWVCDDGKTTIEVLNDLPSAKNSHWRPGWVNRVFRFLKHDLLFEAISLRSISLYSILITSLRRLGSEEVKVEISSPPFPFLSFLLQVMRVPYRVDLRDPWSLHPTLAIFSRHRKWIERRVLRRATQVTVATMSMARDIRRVHGVRCEVVYNYCDLSDEEFRSPTLAELALLHPQFDRPNQKKRKRLVYCGTVPHGFYDIPRIESIILGALEVDYELELYFVGTGITFPNLRHYENLGRVIYVAKQNRRMALIYTMTAEYVLFFGHKFDGYLTTKLFEYIALKKTILPICLPDSYEAATLIRKHYGSFAAVESAKDLLAMTRRAM